MPRVYDDISHLRQPYLQARLGGPSDEAQALGVYMTRGPVDSAPLPVHHGYGIYETSGPVDAPPLRVRRGIGMLGELAPLAAAAQGRSPYQEMSPVDAITVQAWLSMRDVRVPSNPSPDVKTPGSVYVVISPLDLPVDPGYSQLGLAGAAWAAQEIAKGRFIVVNNTGWDPDIINLFASVDPSQIGKQAAPGGNWAVVMKPLSAKVPGGGGPEVQPTATTCAELGLRGAWPNCEPWPDVRFPPPSGGGTQPGGGGGGGAPVVTPAGPDYKMVGGVVGILGLGLLAVLALKKR